MINNRIVSLIYKSILVTVCLICNYNFLIDFSGDTLLYFTVLSNILVFIVTIMVWIKTIKKVVCEKSYEGKNENFLIIKGVATLCITVTGLVYAFLLAEYNTKANYYSHNLMVHYIVPILFVLDYFLFDQKGKTKWYHPLIWIGCAILYIPYVFIRVAIINATSSSLTRYPYFFLNAAELGVGGVAVWCVILVIVFSVIAYAYYIFDYFYNKKKNNIEVTTISD
ncbi:MAG: hypothetical protein E7176_03840 [Erysipelotrichaceae bacterium]|nr:hypothetical protein [Erysipelotrichaceae bacterium]